MYMDQQTASVERTGSGPALTDARASASLGQPRTATSARAKQRQYFERLVPTRSGGLLSREEELSLFRRWREGGDSSALDTLVLAYEPLVNGIIGGLRGKSILAQDAKQEARCGLLEAARRFDPDKNFRFGTYARWWMLSAVSTYLIANREVISSRRTKGKPKAPLSYFVSFDAPINPDGDSLAELIPSDDEAPDLIVEQTIDGERMRDRLANALSALEPRERQILRRRHLKEEPDTLQTIAGDMQISTERVRQIEKAALARLRNILERRGASRV